MLEGIAYLIEGITLSPYALLFSELSLFPPMPSSSVSFLGENLDYVAQTTMALISSLPPWRHPFAPLHPACQMLWVGAHGRAVAATGGQGPVAAPPPLRSPLAALVALASPVRRRPRHRH